MVNDSGTAGYLTPIGTPTPYDDSLLDLLQPIIVGLVGYVDPSVVRPSVQIPNVPNQPEPASDWCGFRISRIRPDTFSYEGHVPNGNGYSVVENTEELDWQLSFYGPNAMAYAMRFRKGLQLGQNRVALHSINADLISCGEAVTLPALLHGIFQRRVDVTATLRRYTSEKYSVQTIVDLPSHLDQAPLGLDNGQYVTPIYPR